MRKVGVLALAATLLISGGAFATNQVRTLEPQKHVDVPSFLGYVPDRFVVVLKENVTVDHSKDARSPMALSGVPGFDALARQFEVSEVRQQFSGADKAQGAATDGRRNLARYYKVTFHAGTLDDVMAAYGANPLVDHVEPIGIHSLYATPNDPYYDDPPPSYPHDQWHYWDTYGIDADQAWDANTGDATVVVGVLDSGIKYDHGDLGGSNPPGPADNVTNGNVWVNSQEIPGNGIDDDGNGYIDDVVGWDFVASTNQYAGVSCTDADCGTVDNDPFDGHGHGTHVSGTIAAITNNGYAVAGVAGGWGDGTFSGTTANGVKVVPMRIGYRARYHGQTIGVVVMDYIAESMYYMANLKQRGENVVAVNCSFGSSNTGGLGAAVDYLLAQDVMIIVAAGNENSSSPDYLGSRTDCMDVGGTAPDGGPYAYSNYGPWVDLAAPAVDVLSTVTDPGDPGGDYIVYWEGTSMACPHVVGTAALLKSCNPNLTASQIWNYLVTTTTPYSGSKDLGSGIVNAKNALDAAGCGGQPCDLAADFSGTPTSGCAPLMVNFTDLSTGTGIDGWLWDFGNGDSSTAQNPSYTYNSAGTYTVNLTVSSSGQGCSYTQTKTGYVTVQDVPVADFSGSPTSGNAPLTVDFTDLSTGNSTSWSWDFGDGNNSGAQNPSHTYDTAGTFTVSLTASNACGSDNETKVDYITVAAGQQCYSHVSNITVDRRYRGPNVNGEAYVTVVDQSGSPVANATVYGSFNEPNTSTKNGITGSDGVAFIEGDKTKSSVADFCFEVTDVTHATCTYNEAANVVTLACESGPVSRAGSMLASAVPDDFHLQQNFPNPFNPTTTISFFLPTASEWSVSIYNITGQRIDEFSGFSESGTVDVTWNASKHASGMYLYKLEAGTFSETRKMVLLK